MADIKKLIDRKTGRTIYPQTIAKAIYDSYGKDLQTRLDELNQNYVATSAQVLTDAQKTQARTNINSAPGGFGLGQVAYGPTFDGKPYNADGITGSGFFSCKNGTPVEDWGTILHIQDDSTTRATQWFKPTFNWSGKLNITKDTVFKRERFESTWEPWEYINPPMELGTEYRTTERYLGKPVYVQVVDFGRLPNTAAAGKYIPNMDNVDKTIRWSGLTSNGYSLPGGNLYTSWDEIAVRIVGNRIDVKTTTDESAYTAMFTLWYTKTTD